jgi:hypothetical protein
MEKPWGIKKWVRNEKTKAKVGAGTQPRWGNRIRQHRRTPGQPPDWCQTQLLTETR